MLNMIKADLYRIIRGKAIYVAILVIVIMASVSVYMMNPGHIGMSVQSSSTSETQMSKEVATNINNPTDLREYMKKHGGQKVDTNILGANTNLYYMFIIVAFIAICSDFSNKSIKNTLTSAVSRKKYYLSKVIFTFIVSLFLIILNNGYIYILNILINGVNLSTPINEYLITSLSQVPLLLGMISLIVAISFITRKAAVFNGITILFIMIVQLVGGAIVAIFNITNTWFLEYEFQSAITMLAHNPSNDFILKCGLLGIVYIVLFNLIGYYSFNKAEI